MSRRAIYLWTGFGFALLPIVAFVLLRFMTGEVSSGAGAWIYLPAAAGLVSRLDGSTPGVVLPILGFIVTFGGWFLVGLGVAALAPHATPSTPVRTTVLFFLAVVLFGVVLPAWSGMISYTQRTGNHSTLEDCRNIDPSLNGGNDQATCVHTVASRMINAGDPAVDEAFCNSLVENDSTMGHCWQYLASKRGTDVTYCDVVVRPYAYNQCLASLALTLLDETICDDVEENDGGRMKQACRENVASAKLQR